MIKIQRTSNKETLEQIISETPFLKMNNIKTDDYNALIDLMAEKAAWWAAMWYAGLRRKPQPRHPAMNCGASMRR